MNFDVDIPGREQGMPVSMADPRRIVEDAAWRDLDITRGALFAVAAVDKQRDMIELVTVPVFGYRGVVFCFRYRDVTEIKYALVTSEECVSVECDHIPRIEKAIMR